MPRNSKTFASLGVPNFRRFFAGQLVSLIGTWMQRFGQSWLVLQLTDNPTVVGLVVGLQALPLLLLGPYGGVIVDRVDRRRLMVALQAVMGLLALLIGMLVVTHVIQLWEVFVIAGLLGLNDCLENPARQTFIYETVGPDQIRNAVTLNTIVTNVARATGPAAGALVVATMNIGACFLINAATFVPVILSLIFLDKSALSTPPPTRKAPGQLLEGLTYVRTSPDLWIPILMMAIVGTFVWEYQVSLPALSQVFHSGATGYGLLNTAQGIGAVVGGLVVAGRGGTGRRYLSMCVFGLGGMLLLVSIAPNLWLELGCLSLVGVVGVSFVSGGNATLQLSTQPAMRGRVMSLWAMAFQGSTPIGGPIVGYIASAAGGRVAFLTSAASCACAGIVGIAVRGGSRTASDRRQAAEVGPA